LDSEANPQSAAGKHEFPNIAREHDLTDIRMGLTLRFQPRRSGSLKYRGWQNESNQNAFDYAENAVSATL
jgi:uncharacterized protein (PEP-CTERM system associated)